MIYRSPRLTAIFGAPPESVTYEQLAALEGDHAAAEAEDLDYKLKYDSGETGTQDIAIDIATFANHLGGVIVVGMAEANALPSKAVGVELSDATKRRIHTAAADRIFPLPQFEVRMVVDPSTTDEKIPKGFILIIIPPSSHAPHAVINPGEKKDGPIRWPRRHGSKKIWLSESEIAAAYRRRFTAAADQSQRLLDIAQDVEDNLEKMQRIGDIGARLTVSLVPDVLGDLIIDQDTFRRFQHEIRLQNVMVDATGSPELPSAGVGRRRLVRYSGPDMFVTRAELHSDGAGSLATQLPVAWPTDGIVPIWDTLIVLWAASALRLLARHARDRAGASGIASTSVRITPYGLHYQNAPSDLGGRMKLVTPSQSIPGSQVYGDEHEAASGYGDFLLDDLADDGQPLAAATAQLVGDLFQSFNTVGTRQISRDGVLQVAAWGSDWSTVWRWPAAAGIPTNPPQEAGGEQRG